MSLHGNYVEHQSLNLYNIEARDLMDRAFDSRSNGLGEIPTAGHV